MGSTVLSRRAAVRGAVWSLPAVTVATAAPAFANTSNAMALKDFAASYVGRDGLAVSGTVVAGAVAQAGTLTLRIEPKLITSVSSNPPAAVTGSFNDGWTLVYTVTAGPFSANLDLGGDDLTGLFAGYRGDQTVLLADVAPSGMTGAEPVPVSALGPKPEFEPPLSVSAAWTSSTAVRVETTDVRLSTDPQPSVGRLRVAVKVPTAVYLNPNPPKVSDLAPGWQVDPLHTVAHWGGGWSLRFVTTQQAHTSLTGTPEHRGPGGFGVTLTHDDTGYFESDSVKVDFSTDETAFGWNTEVSKIDVVSRSTDLDPRPPTPAG